jgi:hypothetical protein
MVVTAKLTRNSCGLEFIGLFCLLWLTGPHKTANILALL